MVQMLLSLYWVWHYGELYYLYHCTNMIFFFMYPDWALFLFMSMGMTGFFIGLSVFLRKTRIKKGYYLLFGLFFAGLIMDHIVVA